MANFWCKLPIDIIEQDWFGNPKMLQLYVFFLSYANRNRLNNNELSFNISYKIIEAYTGMERRAIRWYLDRLEEEGVIKICANCRNVTSNVTKRGTSNVTNNVTNNVTSNVTKGRWLKMRVILYNTESNENEKSKPDNEQRHQPRQELRNKPRNELRNEQRHDVRQKQDFYLFNNNIENNKNNIDFLVNLEENLQDCGGGGRKTEQDFEKFLEDVKEEWNKKCGDIGKIKYFGEARIKKLQELAPQFGDLGAFKKALYECFSIISSNKFLSGKGPKKWKCTFGWLISSSANISKVLEGYYQNLETPQNGSNETKYRPVAAKNIGVDAKATSAEDYSETF